MQIQKLTNYQTQNNKPLVSKQAFGKKVPTSHVIQIFTQRGMGASYKQFMDTSEKLISRRNEGSIDIPIIIHLCSSHIKKASPTIIKRKLAVIKKRADKFFGDSTRPKNATSKWLREQVNYIGSKKVDIPNKSIPKNPAEALFLFGLFG